MVMNWDHNKNGGKQFKDYKGWIMRAEINYKKSLKLLKKNIKLFVSRDTKMMEEKHSLCRIYRLIVHLDNNSWCWKYFLASLVSSSPTQIIMTMNASFRCQTEDTWYFHSKPACKISWRTCARFWDTREFPF